MNNISLQSDLNNRLKRIEGQVSAIRRAITAEYEEDHNCKDVVIQVKAARSALKKVGQLYLTEYVEQCLAQETDKKKREEKIAEALQLIGNQ